ncbi:hypothetical protein [Modicisalibacter luteus]|uniref:hypothetical protein n=1 Tax=Modicisalibacter luteus TaxID=453962 RepID=UPI00363FEBA7
MAVDGDATFDTRAERLDVPGIMNGIGRGDQQFAGHAAGTGTSRAVATPSMRRTEGVCFLAAR